MRHEITIKMEYIGNEMVQMETKLLKFLRFLDRHHHQQHRLK